MLKCDPESSEIFQNIIINALESGISKPQLADSFSVSVSTINRWVSGKIVPGKYVRMLATDRVKRLQK